MAKGYERRWRRRAWSERAAECEKGCECVRLDDCGNKSYKSTEEAAEGDGRLLRKVQRMTCTRAAEEMGGNKTGTPEK